MHATWERTRGLLSAMVVNSSRLMRLATAWRRPSAPQEWFRKVNVANASSKRAPIFASGVNVNSRRMPNAIGTRVTPGAAAHPESGNFASAAASGPVSATPCPAQMTASENAALTHAGHLTEPDSTCESEPRYAEQRAISGDPTARDEVPAEGEASSWWSAAGSVGRAEGRAPGFQHREKNHLGFRRESHPR